MLIALNTENKKTPNSKIGLQCFDEVYDYQIPSDFIGPIHV